MHARNLRFTRVCCGYLITVAAIAGLGFLALHTPAAPPPLSAAKEGAAQEGGLIEVCHCPPGNPDNCHTILINPAALPAHLAHGDTLGRCECEPAPPGMVSWWDGDAVIGTTAFDIQNDNDGTLTGGVGIVPGKVGQAFGFDGVDDFVAVPDAPSLNPESVTVDAWVNLGSAGAGLGPIIALKDSAYGLRHTIAREPVFIFWTQNPTCTVDCGLGTDGLLYQFHFLAAAVTIPLDTFTHLAGTYDSGTGEARLYVNGAQVASTTVMPGRLRPFGTDFLIGGGQTVGGTPVHLVDGVIDEVELFDRVLFADEVEALFLADSAGKCKP